jgi:hypothetical protein
LKPGFFTKWAGSILKKSLAQLTANFTHGLDLNDAGAVSAFTKPFAQSAWVRSAISKVAGPISAVDLFFTDDENEVEDPRLAAFWSAPALNPDFTRMSIVDFKDISVSWLLLRGEVFYILDDSWVVPFPDVAGGIRTPLIIPRPDRMREVVFGGQLQEWVYTDVAGKQTHFSPDRILQIKLFNPYNQWRGLGPMEAAMIAAGGDYAAGLFAKNTAEANGDQGVYVVAKGGIPDDKQREQIVNQLREKRAMQQRGIFRPAFLTGDITIEDPKVRAVDVAFISQRTEARREIAIAFGVPPSFFDPLASYSIGSQSDRFILIEETCKPLGARLCGGWAAIASHIIARPVTAKLDWDDHSVMQAVRRERLDSALKLWGTGMPMKEVSDYLSLELPEYPGWDRGFLPLNLAPIDEATQSSTDNPALAEPDIAPPDPVKDAIRALQSGHRVPENNGRCGTHCGCSVDEEAMVKSGRDPKEITLWKSIVSKRRETLKIYLAKFSKVLMIARAQVLRKLERAALEKALTPEQRSTAADFLFDLMGFDKTFQFSMRGVALDALQKAGDQVLAEIGKDEPWKMPQAEAMRFLSERKSKLSGVSKEVYDRIRDKISEGLTNGDPLSTIADSIRAEFNDISKVRGLVIAQTETSAAYGFGRHTAMKEAGIKFKKWLTSGNSNVRAAHQDMNGEIVPIDELFLVVDPRTGESDEILHPGDSAGEPWNVINCHCVEVASKEGPEE